MSKVSIPPSLASDPNVSLKAKGLYAAIASKPAGWSYCEDELIACSRDSRHSVRAGLKELLERGWLEKWSVRANGQFGRTDFRLHTELPDQETKR